MSRTRVVATENPAEVRASHQPRGGGRKKVPCRPVRVLLQLMLLLLACHSLGGALGSVFLVNSHIERARLGAAET